MSSREFAEWMALAQVEPFGDDRGDLQMAILASVIANANRDPEKRREPFKPAEFIHDFWQEPEGEEEAEGGPKQSWQEQLALVEMLNTAFGGRDLRGAHGNAEKTVSGVGAGQKRL